MTGPQQQDLPGGAEASAAEYVLGLLPEAELRGFETQLARDPDLQQDVATWREYFAALTDPITEETPRAEIFRLIEARLYGAAKPAPRGLWRQLMPYVLGAVAAAAIAWTAMVSGLLTIGEPEPHLYADLVAGEQGLQLLAHYAPDSGTFMVRRDAGDYPADRSLEVWLLSDAEQAPVSIGLVDREGLTEIPLASEIAVQLAGATIALSEEPAGGSPTGLPTGPVIALGQLAPRG
ncbi:anti-sigma factor [Salipiger sp. PrR002]|uniref:anti-sigma factor n=1 Tax=Salipiger sp. PrR002 TaxID=2706489 RepID=UPI0013B91218|nr:anti-sigma factor [Salipiger sp. PrR002]NDW01032.1 hypothetical protein [Salipiger sp. PrR002]NDW58565.1 hypothetical protein [Salipiger sp. PrR004]